MAPECYARHPHLIPPDAVFEVRRGRAKVGNKPNGVMWLRYLEGKGAIDEVYKNILLRVLTVDKRPCPREVKIEADDGIEPRRRPVAPEVKIETDDVVEPRRKPVAPEVKIETDDVVEPRRRPVAPEVKIETDDVVEPRRRPVAPESRKRKYSSRDVISNLRYVRGRVGRKPDGLGWSRFEEGKGAMNELYKDVLLSLTVDERPCPREVKIRTDEEDFCEPRKIPVAPKNGKRKYRDQHDDCGKVPLREKAAFGYCAVKKEPDDCVEGSTIILDSNKVIKKEIAVSFICSKRYHSSMAGEGCANAIHSEFRRELLEVLKKPYDREEYRNSREAIKVGSYLDHYPGVQRKLTKYRYKRDKLMIIVRGFLFWLQNLTCEGSFRPWEDKQCLKLKLPSR